MNVFPVLRITIYVGHALFEFELAYGSVPYLKDEKPTNRGWAQASSGTPSPINDSAIVSAAREEVMEGETHVPPTSEIFQIMSRNEWG